MANVQLAEQFFLVSHDETSGRPLVSIERVECGLVGAMFGELIIDGRLGINDGLVVVLDKDPVDGGISDSLVNTVDQQSTEHRIRTWARELGPDAYRITAERLIAGGLLRRERGRKLFTHAGERYPAVDLYDASRPRLMLNHVLYNREEIYLSHALLAALLSVVGVQFVLGHDTNRQALRSAVTSLVKAMPRQLQELIAGIDETIASISMTRYR
jgi:Golgi phosphoprotein 3 GPP34